MSSRLAIILVSILCIRPTYARVARRDGFGAVASPAAASATTSPNIGSLILAGIGSGSPSQSQSLSERSSITTSSSSSSSSPSPVTRTSPAVSSATRTPTSTVSPTSPSTTALALGTSVVTVQLSGTNVVVGSEILSLGSVTSINGQQLSQISSGLVIGTGSSATTMIADPTPTAQQVTLDSTTVGINQVASNIIVIGSSSLVVGGNAQTIGGQVVSAGTSAVIVGQGSSATTVNIAPQPTAQQITIQPLSLPVSELTPTVVALGSQTLTVGGAAQTIQGQIVSAAPTGLILGTGADTTTMPIVDPLAAANVVTLGSITLTRSISTDGGEILANAATTMTLSPGGSAVTAGSALASLGSGGLLIQAGGSQTTLGTDIISLPSETLTRTQLSGGAAILSNAQTTVTLSPGGPAATLGGGQISAVTGGLIANLSSSTAFFGAQNQTSPTATAGTSSVSATSPVSPASATTSAESSTHNPGLQNLGTDGRRAVSMAINLVVIALFCMFL